MNEKAKKENPISRSIPRQSFTNNSSSANDIGSRRKVNSANSHRALHFSSMVYPGHTKRQGQWQPYNIGSNYLPATRTSLSSRVNQKGKRIVERHPNFIGGCVLYGLFVLAYEITSLIH